MGIIDENFVEHEDGSATITITVDERETQILIDKGFNLIMIESIFNTNVNEIIELLKTARKEENVI